MSYHSYSLDEPYCYIFDKQLEYKTNVHGCYRCPECLEAEKQYKEKENEKTK